MRTRFGTTLGSLLREISASSAALTPSAVHDPVIDGATSTAHEIEVRNAFLLDARAGTDAAARIDLAVARGATALFVDARTAQVPTVRSRIAALSPSVPVIELQDFAAQRGAIVSASYGHPSLDADVILFLRGPDDDARLALLLDALRRGGLHLARIATAAGDSPWQAAERAVRDLAKARERGQGAVLVEVQSDRVADAMLAAMRIRALTFCIHEERETVAFTEISAAEWLVVAHDDASVLDRAAQASPGPILCASPGSLSLRAHRREPWRTFTMHADRSLALSWAAALAYTVDIEVDAFLMPAVTSGA